MADSVARSLVKVLEDAGATHVFGIVGDAISPFVHEVDKSDKLTYVHVRHEEVAAFAAGAQAQLSGRLGVCCGTSGPGGIHLINGLYDSHKSGAPVLAIIGQVPTSERGTNYFQEVHLDRLFVDASFYSETVTNADQMPRIAQLAAQTALSRGGVSVVSICQDIQEQDAGGTRLSHTIFTERPVVQPDDESLERLAELIDRSHKITIFGGAGCRDGRSAVLKLAERIKAPIAHPVKGKDIFEADDPYEVGITGLLGYHSGKEAVMDCDLLLMLGTDFPYDPFLPSDHKIAQVDIRPENLGRRCKLDLGLVGDVGATVTALLPKVAERTDSGWLDHCVELRDASRKHLDGRAEVRGSASPVHPEVLAAAISRYADDNAIFTIDNGMNIAWSARYLRMRPNMRILGSFNHGSMANAMPQAIGAQYLYSDRQVIAWCGDGGFTMLMGDLITIAMNRLPIKLIIFNNEELGMVHMEMEAVGMPPFDTHHANPNFADLARSMGMTGIRIEDDKDVDAAVKEALSTRGPVLLDVRTNAEEMILPPQLNREMVTGFSTYLGKEVLEHPGHLFHSLKSQARV